MLISSIMIGLGLGIPLSFEILLIIPLSLIGGMIKPKYTCLAYTVPIIYIIDCILHYLGIRETKLIPYENFIILIGILHAIEGLLTTRYGANDNTEVTSYNGNKIAGGYQLDRKWYVPLLFFSFKGIYIPIVALVAYRDETYTMKPQEKSAKMGIVIKSYGCLMILIGALTKLIYLPLIIGIFFTAVLHELMFAINEQIEIHAPINRVPKTGLRIVATTQSPNFYNPFNKGDIIQSINDEPINTLEDYENALDIETDQYKIVIKTLEDTYQTIYCNKTLLQRAKNVFLPSSNSYSKHIS